MNNIKKGDNMKEAILSCSGGLDSTSLLLNLS